ncbi:MAG: ABC transporter permease [Armatimonadetes bacterium]|nr:ABC transporter permease [Anaerolineae bacterium]
MLKYVIRRLVQSIPIFFGITFFAYLLMWATPGGPAASLGFGLNARDIERLKIQLGLNDTFCIQYLRWLTGDDWMRWDGPDEDNLADGVVTLPLGCGSPALVNVDGNLLPPGDRYGILRGDFGRSFVQKRPVIAIITERFPATLELGVLSLVIGLTVGIVIGVLAAVRQGGWFDNATRVLAVGFDAMPIFFLALMLLLIFGSALGWLPLGGRCRTTLTDTCPPLHQRLEYLILPTFALATGAIGGYSRYMRAAMLDVISNDYIRTARAKGLSENQVWFKHGLRNAMIPIATFLGPAITSLLAGAVITETIFAWPGVGRVTVGAVTQRDYPVVMAGTVFAAAATILGYLISDILYGLIDPRIRYN